ncbi:Chemotaxis protein PomA [compost metagenome]
MPMISISTVLGILLGFGLTAWAIVAHSGSLDMFWSLEPFAIIFGGTVAAAMIGARSRYVWRALVTLGRIFVMQPIQPATLRGDIKQMVEWSYLTQQSLGPLEDEIAKKSKLDPFVKYALTLLMNGYKEPDLRLFLGDFIESEHQRRLVPANILHQMGGHAPAFGMVGTLIGLVIMMANMGSDPSKIGPAMAVALLATLYGVMAARLLFIPAASKTQQILEIQRHRRYMQLEGIVMIAQKKAPLYIQDRLNALMDPAFHYDHFADKKGQKAPART